MYHHSLLYLSDHTLLFFAVQLEAEKNACVAAEARRSCCAFSLLFPDGKIPVAQAGSAVSLVEQKKKKKD